MTRASAGITWELVPRSEDGPQATLGWERLDTRAWNTSSEEAMGAETFHQSLQRCVRSEEFFTRFYDTFTATSPEIEAIFADVDMAHQRRALKISFYMVTAHTGSPERDGYFTRLRGRHQELGIERRHYDMWLDALVETVAQSDPKFDASVEASWRDVMGDVIRAMLGDDGRTVEER